MHTCTRQLLVRARDPVSLTLMPLLFWTSCHMWARTRGAAGWCRNGLRGAAAKAPPGLRLWSGAHTQLMMTCREEEEEDW